MSTGDAWIEVKKILLKHFLPDTHTRLLAITSQIRSLKLKIS